MPAALKILALFVFLYVFIFILSPLIPALRHYWWVIFIVGVLIFIIFKDKFKALEDSIYKFRKGQRGEDSVVNALTQFLGDEYIYIPNYIIPNSRIGDMDGLIIGPKGVIILEIKNWEGIFRISGRDVYRRLRADIYKLYRKNPFVQVYRCNESLRKLLAYKGMNTRVIPVVVLVSGKISAITGKTEIYITEVEKLVNYILGLPPISNFSESLRQDILTDLGIISYS